ncbi:N-6 DNA methylase [Streptomyces sp. NPDC047968]|uniref:N-6 DNA methylase n=1 Tax=unclassified Streptomyces TaxID=2593676 RepID=UPI0034259720
MPENAAEVTAAGIARLAGVGRAAVSNWRRRHPDFPKPVGGTEASPSFALAEIEQWLRDQGKLAEVPLRERVWQQLAGDPAGAVTALVRTACVLLAVHERPTDWPALAAAPEERFGAGLAVVLDTVLERRFGTSRAVPTPSPQQLDDSAPLLRAAAELAAATGARQTFEFLLGRHLDANPRQYTLTPAPAAELMADLAGDAGTVLDPACGTGALLRAARRPTALCAQDADPDLAALTALRLALHGGAPVRAAGGDALRSDGHEGLAADTVLCHPPFNERNWGHEELAYDPRWEYGFPARTESELAWVQHALARLRPGGTAVLLMPPAVASRRSGRRVRAGLLRRGALRAVVALPAGAAPPYGIPLHLWVLRRPAPGGPPASELLLVDTAALASPEDGGRGDGARERLDWTAVRTAVLDAWRAFDRGGTPPEAPGVSRAVPVLELLDDEVDLTPARSLPPPAAAGTAELSRVAGDLSRALSRATALTPAPAEAAGTAASRPSATVGELARAGALQLRSGGAGGSPADGRPPVLTEQDLIAGRPPSGTLPDASGEEPVLIAPGDVLVPVLGGGAFVRVADPSLAGAVLGRHLYLLRPDPATLDPWFLAGFLRGSANRRQASSHASTASRLDVRRLQLPRLPLAEQRRYGERFRALSEFEDALRLAGRLGDRLVQGLHDGLTDGRVLP